MQINLRPLWAFCGKFLEILPVLFFERDQHAFDVLAGADEIVFVIGQVQEFCSSSSERISTR
jgi:hypothetical protein